MNRSPMKRRTQPLAGASEDRIAERAAYESFRLQLFADYGDTCAYCRDPKARPLDPHHTRKPRARYLMDPETVLPLCRKHHDMAEAAYADGRLLITGSRSRGWSFCIVQGTNKWAAGSVVPGTARVLTEKEIGKSDREALRDIAGTSFNHLRCFHVGGETCERCVPTVNSPTNAYGRIPRFWESGPLPAFMRIGPAAWEID